jgi:hypothetical protein
VIRSSGLPQYHRSTRPAITAASSRGLGLQNSCGRDADQQGLLAEHTGFSARLPAPAFQIGRNGGRALPCRD